MAANPRTEGLGAPGERELAPRLSAEQSAELTHPEDPEVSGSPETLLSDQPGESRHEEIARVAYFLAEARGFEPGHELDDWLAAEQRVRSH